MTPNEYQNLAMRTNDGEQTARLLKACKAGKESLAIDVGGVLNACNGIAGEAGELIDLVKKWIFHEKPLDEEHAEKELGDLLWYVALMCECFGWKLEDIMELNIKKLKKRYPDGFTVEAANHRKAGDI